MAEENETPPAEKPGDKPVDTTAELKAISEQLKVQNDTQTQFNQAMAQEIRDLKVKAQPPVVNDPVDDDDTLLDMSKADLDKRVDDMVNKRVGQAEKNRGDLDQVIMSIAAQYPEARQTGSDLNKKLIEIHSGLPKDLQNTAVGYELAASRAANNLGVLPMSSRSDKTSDFSLSGSRSSAPKDEEKSDLSEKTKLFAEAMGLDMTNKKQVERIKERKRDNWKRYK